MAEIRKLPNGPRGGRYMGPRPKFNKNSFKRLLKYMFDYKIQYIIVIICLIISSITQVISQLFIKNLIDKYITPLLSESVPNYTPLINFLLLLAGIYIFGIVCTFTYNRIMIYVSQGIIKNIRNDMFTHLQELPISYFDENSYGDIMSRFTNDVSTLRQMIGQSLIAFIGSAISLVMTFISMLSINIPLTIVVILGIIVMVLITKNIATKSGKYFIQQQESIGKLNGFIEEMINGEKVIKVFNHEDISKKDFDILNNELCKNNTLANSYGNILGPVSGNLGNIICVIVAVLGSIVAIKTNSFTLGGVAAFLTLTKSFTNPIMQITNQFNSIVMALAGAERIFKLTDEPIEENKGTIKLVNIEKNSLIESKKYTGYWAWKKDNELIPLKGDVRFYDVDFGYTKDKMVLHDISLYAKPGQKIAFVGETGAGKTTITNLINRFYDIDRGVITYDGIDIKDINKTDLRKSLGIVLQDTNLFTGTILDNIRYGNPLASDEDCIKAAKLANADSFIKRLPKGYNTIIKSNGDALSQGQRQLISIARCAVNNPPVMILDEATSSIDTRTEKIVQDGMDRLMDGRTVFVIAHRLSTIQNSKAIIVLENGKIIERGNHKELIKDKGKYYQLYTGATELE